MAFVRSQVFCVFVTVFAVLLCEDLAYIVEGDMIQRMANIGDNITLSCNRPGGYPHNWYRNGTLIADWDGVVINDPRFTQGVTKYGYSDSNNITISNIRMNDSDTFECFHHLSNDKIQSYDLRVIGCSNCIIANHLNPDKMKVTCNLDNYWTRQALSNYIILNENINRTAVILGSTFSFSINVTALNRLHSEFYLQIETGSMITCMLPTKPTSPSFPTTTLPTTSSKQTSQIRPSKVSSDKNTTGGNITLIIVFLSSVFILILIVVIIVLRRKQMKNRRENKHIGNASIKEELPEVTYETVEDGSQKGPEYATSVKELRETSLDQRSADPPENGELIDNILCDSKDNIADGSIARIEGPLDDALYAIPDKRVTISRESKSSSRVTDRSSNSKGDQFENVEMPGSGGDAEEIPLYNMPDDGLMRNTLKATPEAGQTPTLCKDEVDSVDALYAEVD